MVLKVLDMNDEELIDSLEVQGVPRQFSKWALAYFSSAGIEFDTIDLLAYYDNRLTYAENKEIIKTNFPISSLEQLAKLEATQLKQELVETQQQAEYTKSLQSEQAQALSQIKTNPNQNLDPYFFTAQHFVRSTIKNYHTCAILYSHAGGLGKTHLIITALNEEGLKLNEDYIIINGYVTPLEFYNKVYQNKDKIIVCDDVEGLFNNPKGLALIKAMTWGTSENGKSSRVVEYLTTSKQRTAPEQYEFKGRLIFSVNQLPFSNPSINAILSRALFCELKFSFVTKQQIFQEIAKSPYKTLTESQRDYIVQLIFNSSDETTKDFNLRTLIKAYDLYIYSNGDVSMFERLIKELLNKDDELSIIKSIINTTKPVSEMIKEYFNQTGKSRASFFRAKKQLEDSLKVSVSHAI